MNEYNWLTLIFLFSCSYSHPNGKVDGLIEKKIEISPNKVILMHYTESNILLDSGAYVNGKAEGLVKGLDTNDNHYFYKYYKSGIKDGEAIAYYENKRLYYTGKYKNDLQCFEWKFYHPNGKLWYYKYYDLAGQLAYYREYDTTGRLTTYKGNPLVYINYNTDTLKIGELMELNIYMALPPDCDVNLIISQDSSIVGNILKMYDVQEPILYYSETFLEPGIYQRYFIWEIRDLKMGVIEEGKINVPFVIN